jgi:hypothetical protein
VVVGAILAILAIVLQPNRPIPVCLNRPAEGGGCQRPFNAARLLGLPITKAEHVAEVFGYQVRRVAPLANDELLLDDYLPFRLDVETDAPNERSLVLRYVGKG